MLTELDTFEALGVGYYVANLLLTLGFFCWFFFRIDSIVARNGSLDLFLNLAFRLLPWQFLLYGLYRLLYYFL